MISPAELDALRARHDLRSVAESLGARFRGARAKFGACPICGGGASAARFEIKGDRWVCAVCQDGGDVIRLVERVKQLKFVDAVKELGGTPRLSPAEQKRLDDKRAAEKAKAEARSQAYREAERKRLFEAWNGASALFGTPLEGYLRGRGLTWRLESLNLRFAVRVYFEGEEEDERGRKSPREIHRGPCMLAAFVGADGRFLGLHLTWIDADRPGEKARIVDPETGEILPAKKMRGHKQGGYLAILRGGRDFRRIVCGEGIETTLSAREAVRDACEYRAAGDLGNLAGPAVATVAHPSKTTPKGRVLRVPGADPDFAREAMPVPAECVDLTLLKDGDSDPFATELAMVRAGRRHARPGRIVRCADAPEGADFNDLLRQSAVGLRQSERDPAACQSTVGESLAAGAEDSPTAYCLLPTASPEPP